MSDLFQPMLKVYTNANDDIVLVYGSSESEDIQSLDLESMVVSKCDAMIIGKALIKCAKGV